MAVRDRRNPLNNYEHKKLIETITKLDQVPADSQAYSEWIRAGAHLAFLRENARANELVVHASGEYTFVHSVVVPNDRLSPPDRDDLMGWSLNPYTSSASYVTGGGRDDVWVERGLSRCGAKAFENAIQLIFGRTFEGWTGSGRNYFELNQEYAHLASIHWRPERRAYCRFDKHGDVDSVVSISTREDKGSNMALVSFKWEPLEEYLAASNASLVRMFDFTLLRRSGFSGWSDEAPQEFDESDDFFYQQKAMLGHAAYTRGIQIIRPRRSKKAIFSGVTGRWFGEKNREHAEFIAYDWRNNRIAKISTDPNATVNYFNAEGNSLPFELSPVFFRPEILSKYKANREKYTVGERDVSCRATWHLEGIDVNEAGQVHAYICDLRHLPYAEQLHWLSFNEAPKASISKRAVINDFKGEFVTFVEPLQRVLAILRHWQDTKVAWWTLRDERLLAHVNTPLTENRDEWAEAFMDLTKLVVEGFEIKFIRAGLDAAHIPYEEKEKDKTIALLEKLLDKAGTSGEARQLDGLRTAQRIRSKVKGHTAGSDADQLAQHALMEHGTFTDHFRHICMQVADELEAIQRLFSQEESAWLMQL